MCDGVDQYENIDEFRKEFIRRCRVVVYESCNTKFLRSCFLFLFGSSGLDYGHQQLLVKIKVFVFVHGQKQKKKLVGRLSRPAV